MKKSTVLTAAYYATCFAQGFCEGTTIGATVLQVIKHPKISGKIFWGLLGAGCTAGQVYVNRIYKGGMLAAIANAKIEEEKETTDDFNEE